MRAVYLGLVASISLATAICLYCFYVLTTALLSEFDYNFDLETRSPSILPMSAILQWYDPYFNKTSRAMGRYAAFGPIIENIFPDEYLNQVNLLNDEEGALPEHQQNQQHFGSLWKSWVFGRDSNAKETEENGDNANIFEGNLIYVKDNACSLLELEKELENLQFYDKSINKFVDNNTIVINERGGCSFYDKILNFQEKGAKAIFIGNDQYKKGLLTMFSKNIPVEITVPSVFVTKETLNELSKLISASSNNTIPIAIFTGQTPSPLLDALLTLVFSPPIALLALYIIIKLRRSHKKNLEKAPKQIVNKLPLYVYNVDYLIPINEFEKKRDYYLGGFNSSNELELTDSKLPLALKPKTAHGFLGNFIEKHFLSKKLASKSNGLPSIESSTASTNNTPQLPLHTVQRHLSIEELNQYQINQCSICLSEFRKLKSKVVLLPCNHYFHHKCCLNWLCNYKKLCPICKHDITQKVKRKSMTSARPSFSSARSTIMSIFSQGPSNAARAQAQNLPTSHNHRDIMIDRGTSPGIDRGLLAGTSSSMNYSSINVGDENNNLIDSNDGDRNHFNVLINDNSDSSINDIDHELEHHYSISTISNGINDSELSGTHINETLISRHSSIGNSASFRNERQPLLDGSDAFSEYLNDEEQSIENSAFY